MHDGLAYADSRTFRYRRRFSRPVARLTEEASSALPGFRKIPVRHDRPDAHQIFEKLGEGGKGVVYKDGENHSSQTNGKGRGDGFE